MSVPGRWPRLFQLIKQHHNILLYLRTILPLALSGGLLAAHTFISEFVCPHAARDLTVDRLLELWPSLLVVVPAGVFMIGLDIYVYNHLSPFKRAMLEKYFDQAEYWLRSCDGRRWCGFHIGTHKSETNGSQRSSHRLGKGAGRMMTTALWWVSLQTGARLAFGLALWGTYVVQPWLIWLVRAASG